MIKAMCLGAALALSQFSGSAVAGSDPVNSTKLERDPQAHQSASGGAMVVDVALVRPLMIATTVVGSALFLVSLPFSALGGNVGDAADNLVVAPARSAFKRPLGEFE